MASVVTLRARLESSLPEYLSSTLLQRERPLPLTVSMGIATLDVLTGGLPRGALSEITGPASSGRTGVMLAALAEATRRQEVCALVDATDSFDPASAAVAGLDLERLLWVRCSDIPRREFDRLGARTTSFAFGGVLEQVLKVTDLLLQSGGFGMVVLDLGDIPPESVQRVPLTSWFRFRRAVEPTATVLLVVEQEPCAKTCASLVMRLECEQVRMHDCALVLAHPISARQQIVAHKGYALNKTFLSQAKLLRGTQLRAEVIRSSTLLDKKRRLMSVGRFKPVQSAITNFELHTTW